MGRSQRTKGAAYEREVAHAFSDALGRVFTRNIGQARDGGNDIDIGPLVVEVKRRKSLKVLRAWLEQAIAAAVRRPKQPAIPIVVCREDSGPSLVVIRLNDFLVLTRDELLGYLEDEEAEDTEES